MHYRHLFHAGNFADVFKHLLLLALLESMNRKDKPWCYLDTHAGAGAYNLASNDAGRTGEWREGVGRLHASPARTQRRDRLTALYAPGQEFFASLKQQLEQIPTEAQKQVAATRPAATTRPAMVFSRTRGERNSAATQPGK